MVQRVQWRADDHWLKLYCQMVVVSFVARFIINIHTAAASLFWHYALCVCVINRHEFRLTLAESENTIAANNSHREWANIRNFDWNAVYSNDLYRLVCLCVCALHLPFAMYRHTYAIIYQLKIDRYSSMNQRYTLKIETKRFSSAGTGKKIAQIEAICYCWAVWTVEFAIFFHATRIPRWTTDNVRIVCNSPTRSSSRSFFDIRRKSFGLDPIVNREFDFHVAEQIFRSGSCNLKIGRMHAINATIKCQWLLP